MNDLFNAATRELERFLASALPALEPRWWQKLVLDRLSFQQQRIAQEKRFTKLADLDMAALLRVLDQNWFEVSNAQSLPREARSWIKELQTVRNKWAHLPSSELPASESFRDADTLGRVLRAINASSETIAQVETAKKRALSQLAGSSKETRPDPVAHGDALALFAIGQLVCLRSNPPSVMPVIEVLENKAGERRYRVFQNNAKTTYYESQIQALAGTEDARRQLTSEALHAHLTSLQLLSPSATNLLSLRSGRVDFIPYQYRPVLKFIRADRPRLLIADEVGVGKTIGAGRVIEEVRGRVERRAGLIIWPKAVVSERKWFVEMKRFDEHFTAMDGKLLKHCLRETQLEGDWPEQYLKAIIPFSLFDSDLIFGRDGGRDQGLLSLDPLPKFDLVIVDEAHHIRNPETYLHQGVRYFCDNAEAVLFLTATPVQLGSEDLYTLLNVLRPDLIIDSASFSQLAEPNRFINAAVQHCRAAEPGWAGAARENLDEAAHTEWGRLFLREAPAFQVPYDRLKDEGINDADRVALAHAIEGLYTFRPLINRTRRRDIGDFTTRKPETLTVEFTPPQRALHDGLLEVVARILAFCHGNQNVKFLMTTIRRQAASCLYGLAPLLGDILAGKLNRLELMEAADDDSEADLTFVDQIRADIAALLEQTRGLDPHDPKVAVFTKALIEKQSRENNKALVFSTFRHTLAYLASHTERAGLRYGLVHGDVPDDERSELRRRFALPKEDPTALDVLLSSEVGCEGLDFQFCDFLVNYDLPWNPMRIEQRIGRIDRYGQKSQTVAIVNLITPGTVDADIYTRCLWRIGVFQHAVGGNEEILGVITQELHDIAESFSLTPTERDARLKQLADNGIRQLHEEQELESKQAELFGLNIPSQSWRKDIESAESYWLSSAALQCCVSAYLTDRLGKDHEYLLGDKAPKTLRLSQEARGKLLDDFRKLPRSTEPAARDWEKWLKGTQPTVSVTFEQDEAAENGKAMHLSITHPLVRQAALHLKADEPAFVALKVKSSDVPSGEYRFGVYRWTKQGVKHDELLAPIASHIDVEAKLFSLLQTARTLEGAMLPGSTEFDELDTKHHGKWTSAQANHIAENRQQVEFRIQSLTVSHRARCKAIEDQLLRATNDKIRLMKQSELVRANADFNRRIHELEQAAGSGDIHASPVIFGTLVVTA